MHLLSSPSLMSSPNVTGQIMEELYFVLYRAASTMDCTVEVPLIRSLVFNTVVGKYNCLITSLVTVESRYFLCTFTSFLKAA